ncbi:MAG: RCC1 domain-containing protein [Sandaracinaceae bacterium]
MRCPTPITRHRHVSTATLFALLLVTSYGCERRPASQVDVRFTADPTLLEDATEFHLRVENAAGEPVFEETVALGGDVRLSDQAWVLVPIDDDATRSFSLEATLSSVAGVSSTVVARAGYTAAERRVLRLHFDEACGGVECGTGQTCRHGRCVGACFTPGSAALDETSEPEGGECQTCGEGGLVSADNGTACGCGACLDGACETAEVEIVSTRENHTCSRTDRRVFCWGDNQRGQCGVEEPALVLAPREVEVEGPSTGTAGRSHTCWMNFVDGGSLFCWGLNLSAELGLGSLVPRQSLAPLEVELGGVGFNALAAGNDHTCALADDGGIWCWGGNDAGQAGGGSATELLVPTPLPAGGSWLRVAAGGGSTCAIRADGTLWCWGRNTDGQLGTGDFVARQPDPVQTGCIEETCFDDWTEVSVGAFHVCAVRAGGELYCWGGADSGQLGAALTGPQRTPHRVAGEGWRKVTAGTRHTCALRDGASGQELYCWGDNDEGQLGVGDTMRRTEPARVPTLGRLEWTDVVAGEGHTCAIRENRSLFCWGSNASGQLGLAVSGGGRRTPDEVCFTE